MSARHFFNWKTYFYRVFLPALRGLGPERADAAVGRLGRLIAAANPKLRRDLAAAAGRARAALGDRAEHWDLRALPPSLGAGLVRFAARDYLLETSDDARALGRFDASGEDAFREAVAAGKGVILVGAHLGGHLAAFHWLYRSGVPLRLMVQRPRHVSRSLEAFFDREGPDPQSAYFLSRGLGRTDCVERLLRVRSALRSGKAVYFAGDVPWRGPNTRTGRLLGRTCPFLAVWADLSALTGAPVFFTFCEHRPGGRFALGFESMGAVAAGSEGDAVARFLARLEGVIAARPADATAHLLWPCYGPADGHTVVDKAARRPSRRAAGASW